MGNSEKRSWGSEQNNLGGGHTQEPRDIPQESYRYRNMPIPGGGYVTGFMFHPHAEGVFYLRTDIGGAYRFDAREQRWHSLIDHVTMEDVSETFPAAIALDERHPERLYIACGTNTAAHGKFAVSEDYGETFSYYEMPMHVHGNLNGRGTGYRLIVDRTREEVLWFASQESGLWRSDDRGKSWSRVRSFAEDYATFVGQTADGRALFAAGAGTTTKRSAALRGHSLFVSYDDGASFQELWEPWDGEIEGVQLAGLVAQRYALDEQYLYVTFSVMGRNAYVRELGYSCDGGSVIGGKAVRYPLEADGRIGQGVDITPPPAEPVPDGENVGEAGDRDSAGHRPASLAGDGAADGLPAYGLEYGFSGIDTAQRVPGLVTVSTISKGDGDCIYLSRDYGASWECILCDLAVGKMEFWTSYLKPCYNGGHNLIHWLTDLKINPFRPDEVWFNTGTGVFRSRNLVRQSGAEPVVFEDWSDGIEETVHLNVYGPPAGEVKCIDILGDLGGFAFRDLDRPCDNSFDDAEGNRYITCINADYSDLHPELVVVTPRGNWTGRTKGGLIYSEDQCRTFRRLPMPFGLGEPIDAALHRIEQPNVNSGWAAMSSDGQRLVWSIADGIHLPVDQVVVSRDAGEHFERVLVYDGDGRQKTAGGFKVFADRMNPELFYGFGDHSDFYVSEDGGRTFRPCCLPENFPTVDFSLIDCANKTEVRGECGREGVFYMALGEDGLWKLAYDAEDRTADAVKLSQDGDIVYRMGLGIGRDGGDYAKESKAIYFAGVIGGAYGFYRSIDDGRSYVRLNTDRQMFGEINSMDGDACVFGRFYLGTGSRGVLYGEPGAAE